MSKRSSVIEALSRSRTVSANRQSPNRDRRFRRTSVARHNARAARRTCTRVNAERGLALIAGRAFEAGADLEASAVEVLDRFSVKSSRFQRRCRPTYRNARNAARWVVVETTSVMYCPEPSMVSCRTRSRSRQVWRRRSRESPRAAHVSTGRPATGNPDRWMGLL